MVKKIKEKMLYYRCRAAIRRAERNLVITGKKQLVLMCEGKPIVVSKQQIKHLIKQKKFIPGFTPEKAEALAIYKTR